MADKELITKGCEKWLKSHDKTDCLPLSYEAVQDLLSVLKEQEPIEPISQIDREEDYIFLCSNCKGEIFGGDILHDNYCTTCGRLVNWHGRY